MLLGRSPRIPRWMTRHSSPQHRHRRRGARPSKAAKAARSARKAEMWMRARIPRIRGNRRPCWPSGIACEVPPLLLWERKSPRRAAPVFYPAVSLEKFLSLRPGSLVQEVGWTTSRPVGFDLCPRRRSTGVQETRILMRSSPRSRLSVPFPTPVRKQPTTFGQRSSERLQRLAALRFPRSRISAMGTTLYKFIAKRTESRRTILILRGQGCSTVDLSWRKSSRSGRSSRLVFLFSRQAAFWYI
mmetsp:Transcript_29496/g.75616  ORF Transcript_29496/g.75616 Transcript_29496/m.75616 type:complete len:243 (-) Transcript_29496:334-1062(-)